MSFVKDVKAIFFFFFWTMNQLAIARFKLTSQSVNEAHGVTFKFPRVKQLNVI